MRRSLKRHGNYVSARLDELRKLQAAGRDVTAAGRELAAYHHRETQHFQHERLIHLLVTFFFGALLVAALTGLVILGLGDADTPATSSMFMVLSGGCLVVLVLEVFYVNHYYHLENGVQKLYQLDRELAELGGLGLEPPPSPANAPGTEPQDGGPDSSPEPRAAAS